MVIDDELRKSCKQKKIALLAGREYEGCTDYDRSDPNYSNPRDYSKLSREKRNNIWNRWRQRYGDKLGYVGRIDLSYAHLKKADLRGFELSRTDMRGACLDYANLSGSQISDIWLDKSYMRNVNLTDAKLTSAHLDDANLDGAISKGAEISSITWNNENGQCVNGRDVCPTCSTSDY